MQGKLSAAGRTTVRMLAVKLEDHAAELRVLLGAVAGACVQESESPRDDDRGPIMEQRQLMEVKFVRSRFKLHAPGNANA